MHSNPRNFLLLHPPPPYRRCIAVLAGSVLLFSGSPLSQQLHAETASSEAPSGVFALSLDELMDLRVTTISRVDERSDEASGSIYVFSRDTIRRRGYRSLKELLQVVPGFTVFHRDLQFVAGVRGLNANDNAKITLLVNGQNLNNIHEPDFLNGPINLDNVERVEVVVGPSSLFQPANTLAATVNIITRDVNGTVVRGAGGNDLPYSGTLMTGKRWAPDRFITFSLTVEEKDGFDAWRTRGNLASREITGELDWPSFFSVVKGQYGEWSAQAVAYRSTWPELNINSGSMDNSGVFTDEFYSGLIRNEHPWSPDLTSVFSADVTLKQTTRANEDGPPQDAVEQFLEQVVYSGELGLRYRGFAGHVIQGGMQASYDDNVDNYYTWESGATLATALFRKNTYAVGFYIDDTARVTDWLKLIAGLRIDHNTRLDGDRWFPGARGAIIVEPTENWISKLIYNRSVRIPSPVEAMNRAWGAGVDGSPDWATNTRPAKEPEILNTVEFQNITYWGHVRVCLALYHQELDDFTTWFGPHSNGGSYSGEGAEISAQAPLNSHLTLWANASWNDSTLSLFDPDLFGPGSGDNEAHHSYVDPDNRIVGSAGYTVNGGLDLCFLESLTFAPTVRYFTDQVGVDATTSRYVKLDDRYYLDATLRWAKGGNGDGPEMDISLTCRNLLDNRDAVGSSMNGHLYKPRGLETVLAAEFRF